MSTSGVVPIIDFQPFLTGSQAEREATAQELLTAFKDVGFVMLKGFYQDGVVTEALVEEAFAQARTFFELSMVEKEKLAWTCPESNRGYVCQGRERVAPLSADKDAILALRAKAPDMKESIEIGKDYRDSEDDSPFPNLWPESMPEFRPFMNTFFYRCHLLHLEVMKALGLAMGLGEGFFEPKLRQQSHNLRLLNYPSVERGAAISTNRAGAHSDNGHLTLLFQDSVGGLEVKDKDGNFVPATPVPGTVVVNVGDLLARWSNDILKSTVHRVMLPSTHTNAHTPRRQSIAFFCNPSLKQMIECLPGTGEPKYEPIESQEYLVRRLTATYT